MQRGTEPTRHRDTFRETPAEAPPSHPTTSRLAPPKPFLASVLGPRSWDVAVSGEPKAMEGVTSAKVISENVPG